MAITYSDSYLDPMLARAKNDIFKECPEIYFIVRNFRIVYSDSLKYIACVQKTRENAEFLMIFNPRIIQEQGPDFTTRELSIVIYHEMFHLVYGHLYWFKAKWDAYEAELQNCKKLGVKPTVAEVSHQLFNFAADFIINDGIPALGDNVQYYLDRKGGTYFSNMCLVPKIADIPEIKEWLDSGRRVKEMEVNQLYNILYNDQFRNKNNENSEGKSGPSDGGEEQDSERDYDSMDGHGGDLSEEDQKELGETVAPTSDEVEKMVDKAIDESGEMTGKMAGKDSSGLKKFINDYRKVKADRAAVRQIQMFYKSSTSSSTVDSYSVRNRKYGYKSAGQEAQTESRAGVVWDTSQSCFSPEFIDKAISYIEMAKRYVDDIVVVTGDTEAKETYKLKGKKIKAADFKITGSGGSNMNFGPVTLKKFRPDFIIVITDGDIDTFESNGLKTIFFIPKGGTAVPGQKCFFLD